MAELGTLSLTVDASAKVAATSIDTLANKMNKLASSLGSVNGSGMNGVASGLKNLNSAMQGLSQLNGANYTRVATGITKIASIDTAKVQSTASAISTIGKSLASIENVGTASKQITELANAISRLGYKSSTKAIDNIPKLATAMKGLMTTLSSAPKVSSNLIQMTNALAALATTGAASGRAANSLTTSLKSYSSMTSSSTKKSFSLASAIGKATAELWLLWRAVTYVAKAVDLSASLTEIQNVVDTTFGTETSKVEEMAKRSIETLGMSELSFKTYASQFQSMGTAMGITTSQIAKANDFLTETTDGYIAASDSLADVSLNITKLAGDIASFYDKDQADVADDLRSIYTGMTLPLRQYGLDLTEATLQEWALTNGLDSNISSMSQAEKTMLRYQYVMAQTTAAQGDFIKTQDTWANQTRILAENFKALGATIGTPIINACKPMLTALNAVIKKVNEFAQVVSEALGTIFGWKYEVGQGGIATDYETAADSASDLADSTGTAADNAKKLKQYTMGIDELNILNDSSSTTGSGSGSGGSGSGSSIDASSGNNVGKWVEVERAYESEIDTLEKLGAAISNALSNAMESIDWNGVYEKAKDFGTGLADFLNGMFAGAEGSRLFTNTGITIAAALNTAICAALAFGTTMNWHEIGQNIADGINSAFETFDFASAAEAVNAFVQGVANMVLTAIANVNWANVYAGITEFLSNIDISTISIIVGTLAIKKIGSVVFAGNIFKTIVSAFLPKLSSTLASGLSSIFGLELVDGAGLGAAFATLGQNMGSTFMAGLRTIMGSSAAESALSFVNVATKLLTGISSIISGVMLVGVNFFSMWKNGFSWLNEALLVAGAGIAAVGAVILGVAAAPAVVVATIVAAVATVAVVIHDNWNAIKGWFSSAAEWFNSTVIEPTVGFFQGMWQTISGFFTSLWSDIVGIFTPAFEWFNSTVVEPIVGIFSGFYTRVTQIFRGLWIIVQAIWTVASSWFNTYVATPITNLFNAVKTKISSAFATAKTAVLIAWNTVYAWFSNNIANPIKNAFNAVGTTIKNAFSTAKNAVTNTWNTVATWFDSRVISPIKNAFNGLWTAISSGVRSAINSMIGTVEGGINGVIKGINGFFGGFNNIVKAAAKIVGTSWNGVNFVSNVSLPRFERGGFVNAPSEYSLFMAGENGVPEIAGTVGGKTAVAGGAEITGIRDAVYSTSEAQMSMMQQEIELLRQIVQKEFTANIGDRDIARASRRGQRSMGMQIITT